MLFAVHGFSGDYQQLIKQANKDYSAGEYNKAISGYEKVISQGYTAAELYYNLGNAYFKINDYPSAILFYEKACKLKPNDDYIETNLKIANSKIIDKIEPIPHLFYKRWWLSAQNRFTLNGWAVCIIITSVLFCLFAGIYLVSAKLIFRKTAFWSAILLLFVTLLSFTLAFQRYNSIRNQQEGIVFSPTITVKSSPDANSTDVFVIHEGTKVVITDRLDSWVEIKIANGNVGWIQKELLKTI
jgi:tetratricopeptide (TPR) repeat protein